MPRFQVFGEYPLEYEEYDAESIDEVYDLVEILVDRGYTLVTIEKLEA